MYKDLFFKIINYLDMNSLNLIYKNININSECKNKIIYTINKINNKNRIYWKQNYINYLIKNLFIFVKKNNSILGNQINRQPENIIDLIRLNIQNNEIILKLCLQQEYKSYNMEQIIIMLNDYNRIPIFNIISPHKFPYLYGIRNYFI
mgnify:CR=1 FL=1|jgi:hypothetical protein